VERSLRQKTRSGLFVRIVYILKGLWQQHVQLALHLINNSNNAPISLQAVVATVNPAVVATAARVVDVLVAAMVNPVVATDNKAAISNVLKVVAMVHHGKVAEDPVVPAVMVLHDKVAEDPVVPVVMVLHDKVAEDPVVPVVMVLHDKAATVPHVPGEDPVVALAALAVAEDLVVPAVARRKSYW
jgi:hypothetical protein